MKRLFILFVHACMIVHANISFSQNPDYRFSWIDSFSVRNAIGHPLPMNSINGDITLFNPSLANIVTINSSKSVQSVVKLDSNFINKNQFLFDPFTIWRSPEKTILVNYSWGRIEVFDKNGRLAYVKKIKNKKNKYIPNNLTCLYYGNVSSRNTILISIQSKDWKGFYNDKKIQKGGVEMYDKTMLLGELNINTGKILSVYGRYPDIYRQGKLYSYLHYYHAGFIQDSITYISTLLGDSVELYLHGKSIGFIGTRGKFINKESKNLYSYTNQGDFRERNPKYIIEAPFYYDCEVVDNRYLVRAYTNAIEDTVTFSKNELEQWFVKSLAIKVI